MFELRPPQQAACKSVYNDLKTMRTTLAVIATGVGKTVVAAALANRWLLEEDRILFLAHRDELIRQAQDKFWKSRGVASFIEKADEHAPRDATCVIGSVQSLQGERLASWPRDYFTKIIIDEAHRSVADTYLNVFAHFDKSKLLGITATAFRQKGDLSSVYDHVSFEYGLKSAVNDGYLCRIVAQTIPLEINLPSVGRRDFNETEIADSIEPLLEKIAKELIGRATDRKSILFSPTCAIAKKCVSILNGSGFRAYYAGGDDRSQLADFEEDGPGSILCNSMLCTEGYDHAQIDCVIILRPTKSTGLYIQMVGRGTRLFIGKDNCLLLDFLWNSEDHNLCKPSCLVAEDDDTEKVMSSIIDKSGAPIDIISEAETEAVSQIKCERERKLAKILLSLTDRKSKRFDPVLESISVDSSRLATYKAETAWEKDTPTEAQNRALKDMGFKPEGWCKGYASQVIEDVSRRNEMGLATPKQMRTLFRNGIDPRNLSRGEASNEMDKLSKKWAKASRYKDYKARRAAGGCNMRNDI